MEGPRLGGVLTPTEVCFTLSPLGVGLIAIIGALAIVGLVTLIRLAIRLLRSAPQSSN